MDCGNVKDHSGCIFIDAHSMRHVLYRIPRVGMDHDWLLLDWSTIVPLLDP